MCKFDADGTPTPEAMDQLMRDVSDLIPDRLTRPTLMMSYHLVKLTTFLLAGSKRDETVAIMEATIKDLSDVFVATSAAIERYADTPEVITPMLFDVFTRNNNRNVDDMLDAIATISLA